jgi:transcriptional/translational regulatory protein YebC/TACO1
LLLNLSYDILYTIIKNWKASAMMFWKIWVVFNIPMMEADVTMIPQTWVELTDEDSIKKMNRILDLLDEDDDVQAVYHNWDTDER